MTHSEFESFKSKFRRDELEIASAGKWTLSLRPQQLTLGSMVLSSSSGVGKFSDLDEESGSGFFDLLSKAERVVENVFGADRVNVIGLMMKDPIAHFHIIPRYSEEVRFGGALWKDVDWPLPPNFSKGKNGGANLVPIYIALKNGFKSIDQRKLKPWMRRTLLHYEHCNRIFYKEFGDNLYAVGGTLLGGIRDHGFITHDKDMDVAYLSARETMGEVRREFLERILHLLKLGERVTIVDRAGYLQRRHAKWWAEDGSYVDLFPACYDKSGYYSRPTFVHFSLPPGDLLPLRQIDFEGAKIYVPNKTEQKIKTIFGDGWAAPDASWQKPVFAGVEKMRKEFAFSWEEVLEVAKHSSNADREKLIAILDKWANKVGRTPASSLEI